MYETIWMKYEDPDKIGASVAGSFDNKCVESRVVLRWADLCTAIPAGWVGEEIM